MQSSFVFFVSCLNFALAAHLIIPYDCGDKIIILVTNRTDVSTKKVNNLNSNILAADGRNTQLHSQCRRTWLQYETDDLSSKDGTNLLATVAKNFYRSYQKTISAYWYGTQSQSGAYVEFHFSDESPDISDTLKGCVYDRPENEVLHYVSKDEVDAFMKSRYEFLREVDFFEACRRYFETVKSSRDTFNIFNGHPLIIIPGFGCSLLYAKCKNPANKGLFDLPLEMVWPSNQTKLDSSLYAYGMQWLESMDLSYDESTGTTSNDKYDVDTVLWGDPRSTFVLKNKLFEIMTRTMVDDWGYEMGISLRAAPYDFRKGLHELGPYFNKVKVLIEDTYRMNGHRKVVLLAHYQGNMNTVYFLNQQEKTWKEKYIESYICLAANFGGSMSAIKLALRGKIDGQQMSALAEGELAKKARKFPSLPYLLPNVNGRSPDDLIMTYKQRPYTINDFDELFENEWEWTNFKSMHDRAVQMLGQFRAPEVKTHCVYSTGIETEHTFEYSNWLSGWKGTNTNDGDRIVNLRSAKDYCVNFRNYQQAPVYDRQFEGLDHTGMLGDERLMNFIRTVVLP